ncbi:MAG TPA: LytTR family DNA-binding domain-containing protein [Caulobacteraceae bacterium]
MGAPAGTFGAAGGTTGAWMGMDGVAWRAALKAYAAFALLVAVIDTENVFSAVRDRAAMGHPIAWIEPAIWESSSGISFLIFAPVAYIAARLAPLRPAGWPKFALIHALASVVFSSLHILGMGLIRIGAYAVGGSRYHGRLFDFVYEYRKDIPAYIILVGLVWLLRELEQRRVPPAQPAGPTFDIKDGVRVIRAPVQNIVAVSSAGNYIEVVLADGRRPLMRSTLAAAGAALEPHGFVRTHRSWLVNAARVRELTAVGSGDFVLRLEGGAEAPLSRRFRTALERLR